MYIYPFAILLYFQNGGFDTIFSTEKITQPPGFDTIFSTEKITQPPGFDTIFSAEKITQPPDFDTIQLLLNHSAGGLRYNSSHQKNHSVTNSIEVIECSR